MCEIPKGIDGFSGVETNLEQKARTLQNYIAFYHPQPIRLQDCFISYIIKFTWLDLLLFYK